MSKNGNIDANNESWKNIYYRNYDLGEEIAKCNKGTNGLVEIYFDDRQKHLILNCNYEKKSIDTNFYVLLDDFDNVNSLKVHKDVKNSLVVLLEVIKNTGLVRELSEEDTLFGINNRIIQIHSED